jgi:hypothetical protein
MIETAAVSELKADSAVAALVGTRVYPDPAPQEVTTFPRIVYAVDDDEPQMTFGGKSGLNQQRITFSCQARTPAQRDALLQAVINLLNGARGTWSTIVVQGVFLEGGPRCDAASLPDMGADVVVYVGELDFEFWFEDAPAS